MRALSQSISYRFEAVYSDIRPTLLLGTDACLLASCTGLAVQDIAVTRTILFLTIIRVGESSLAGHMSRPGQGQCREHGAEDQHETHTCGGDLPKVLIDVRADD